MNRIKGDLHLLAERNFYRYKGVRLHFAVSDNGRLYAPKPVEFSEAPEGSYIEEFLNLNDTEAQALMDSLYDCGYRPARARDSEGQLEATKYHLEDMRKLVKGLK